MKTINTKIKLNNGVEIPQLGYGSYKVTDEKTGYEAIKHAIKYGYLMIDTAEIYQNHHIVAKAIADSNVDRKDLFLASKIWNTHQTKEKTFEAFERILKELNTDYLDMILVHWPAKHGIESYQALEELYEQGKVRAIGVSNFMIEDLTELLKVVKYVPVVNQVEMHPFLPQLELQEFCEKHNIVLESWRTILNGQASEVPYLQQLAEKYQVDASSICLKWAMQRGAIVIPKSVTLSRIESNVNNLDKYELTIEEIKKIDELGPENRLGPDPRTFDR